MSKITDYFKETKAELKHVIWPYQTPDFLLHFNSHRFIHCNRLLSRYF